MGTLDRPGIPRHSLSLLANGIVLKRTKETTTRTVAAACMLAASPATLALAQSASSSSQLPPLVVEGQKTKKKTVAAKKTSAPPPAAAPAEPTASASSVGTVPPGGNPYANPDAPYEVQQSASGKLTEPLVNTPRTVTAVPKEVIEDKGVRDLRELARDVPGLSIGSAEGGNAYGAFAVRGFKANNDIFVDSERWGGRWSG